MDNRAPANPMDDHKKDMNWFGWPLGKWQHRQVAGGTPDIPQTPPEAVRRGVKRALSDDELLPDDPSINHKAKRVIEKLISGALECEEEPFLLQ